MTKGEGKQLQTCREQQSLSCMAAGAGPAGDAGSFWLQGRAALNGLLLGRKVARKARSQFLHGICVPAVVAKRPGHQMEACCVLSSSVCVTGAVCYSASAWQMCVMLIAWLRFAVSGKASR